MWRVKRNVLIRLIAIGISLSVCSACIRRPSIPKLPEGPTPVPSIPGYSPITASNAGALTELSSVVVAPGEPILALDIDSITNLVVAVAAHGTTVMAPLVESTKSVTREVVPMVTQTVRAVNATMGIVVSSSFDPVDLPSTSLKAQMKDRDGWEYHIWNIRSGIEQGVAHDYGKQATAVVISPNGDRLVTSSIGDLVVYNAVTGKQISYLGISYDNNSVNSIVAMAIDSANEYLATANVNGDVQVNQFTSEGLPAPIGGGSDLEGSIPSDEFKKELKPLGLAFDPTRTRLALLRDNEAIVYDLSAWRQIFKVNVTSTTGKRGGVALDPSGQLLAVGTQDGWQIWDVAHSTKLFEQVGAGTYTVAFSADGRAFVWGDLDGHVHIWVARKS
jgi:WD40 repeat protein